LNPFTFQSVLSPSLLSSSLLQDDVKRLAPRTIHKSEVSAENVVNEGDVFELTKLKKKEDGGGNTVEKRSRGTSINH
jgi:hypothetical protein